MLFVRTIRISSLRVAMLFLGLMFCYDVFMVFLSPLLLGKSVMLTVALAGAPTAVVTPAGYCERSSGEAMPMLMLIFCRLLMTMESDARSMLGFISPMYVYNANTMANSSSAANTAIHQSEAGHS